MRRPIVAATAAATVALGVVVNLATDTIDLPAWSGPLVWSVAGLLGLVVVVTQVRQTPPAASADDSATDRDRLYQVMDSLSETLTSQWKYEEERRRLHDPFPLTLRWTTADENLIDHWANIRQLPSGKTSGPVNLNGELSKIRETYRRVPSRRLVILGGAGSGKTVLALHLVLDLLNGRRTDDLVPVMFNLRSWNPTTTPFRGWLVDQLLRDHPGLSRPGVTTENLAAELVNRRKILPVLDGFDEMAAGLHRAALEALNRNRMALVVTSRTEEFKAAVRSADVLTAAAAIEISELKLADVASYLPRTAAQRPSANGRPDWEAVLAELRDHPDDEAATSLRAVLSSPLMVGLARTIYSDTPDTNPKELLDTDVLRSPAMVERHLLNAFIPAAYHQPSRRRSAVAQLRGRYTVTNVKRWLTHLAGGSTQEIRWWKLSGTVHPVTATALYTAMFATIFGTLFRVDAAAMLTAICASVFTRTFRRSPRPAQAHLQMKEFVVALKQEVAKGMRGTLGEGLLFGSLIGGGFGVLVALNSLNHAVARGSAIGLVCWLVGTTVYMGNALRPRMLSRSVNTNAAPCPIRMITDDRKCAIVRSLVYGLAISLPTYALFDLRRAAEMAGAVAVVSALSGTAWGRWVVIGRFWLPLTGRLPWKLHAFLDDACERGVLRQTGAAYEFRHVALRDNLRTTAVAPEHPGHPGS